MLHDGLKKDFKSIEFSYIIILKKQRVNKYDASYVMSSIYLLPLVNVKCTQLVSMICEAYEKPVFK